MIDGFLIVTQIVLNLLLTHNISFSSYLDTQITKDGQAARNVRRDIVIFFNSNRFEYFDLYFGNESKHNDINMSVDTIVFNSDSTRFVALLLVSYYYNNKSNIGVNSGFYFDMVSVIGYANNNEWKIYNFNRLFLKYYSNTSRVIFLYRNFYFRNIEKEYANIFNISVNEIEKRYYNNLSDKTFWDSFIWEIGLCYPGKYFFELRWLGSKNGRYIYKPLD